MTAVPAILAAELLKLRTLRSTFWLPVAAVVVSAGFGALVALSARGDFKGDKLFAVFYSLTLGQLPLVALAVMAVTAEYGSGTLAVSLAAVPRRARLWLAKTAAVGLTLAVAALVTVGATVAVALPVLGLSVTSPGVPTALVGAWLAVVLIGLFALGVAGLLRRGALALGILLPVLLLGSQGLGNIPKVKTVTQFLPDQTAWVIMHLTGAPEDPQFGRPYGPWEGLAITALWAVAALVAGGYAVHRRDP